MRPRKLSACPPASGMLLFVGRIEPLKGIDTLIRALAILRTHGHLRLPGGHRRRPQRRPGRNDRRDGPPAGSVRAAGLNDLVTFLGKRSQDTLPYYYSAAEAVVVPSHYESFGMVALEAMACGTPVVASQVGGLAFLVQDGVTGFTVPVDEPQALADRLSTLLSDPDLRLRMGRQAAEFARGYGWDQIAARIITVYQELLSNPGARAENSPHAL